MTKPLTNQQKKEKEAERRKRSDQQKAPSTSSTHVKVNPKAEGAPPTEGPVNFCDTCAYTVGECDGVPKFAIDKDPTLQGADADRVVE